MGSYPCRIRKGTVLKKCYGASYIEERHRHRYEMNNEYRSILSNVGLIISGTSPDDRLVEAIEWKSHPFYIGVQFHPEFKSRPNRTHPLFREFIQAALNRKAEEGSEEVAENDETI